MSSQLVRFSNALALPLTSLPILSVSDWRQAIWEGCIKDKARLIAVLGARPEKGITRVVGVLGCDHEKALYAGATDFDPLKSNYAALTPDLPEAHLFERELYENWRITPIGHPWLKPVRNHANPYLFYALEGKEIHEVAVGPVHAGIIEPGHFRFQCHGETVLHCEIQLGFQHRGVERLMEEATSTRRMILSESIAGDTVAGHGLAYVQAMEGLSESVVTQRAHTLRGIALELERLANHTGDLGALANDIGFLSASAYFGRLRGECLNLLMVLSGNRYGRSFIRPGGVLLDMPPAMAQDFQTRLSQIQHDLTEVASLFFGASSVLSRLESTGILPTALAKEIGVVGMTARASHLSRDVRTDYPFGIYKIHPLPLVTLGEGDVYARARIRFLESKRSLEYLLERCSELPPGPILERCERSHPSSLIVSLVEGWRGEIAHVVITNETGNIARYKIIDPSFHNWTALALVMRQGQISDFPLCNKSFNLSYSGHDL